MKKLVEVGKFSLTPQTQMDFRLCLWKPSHFPTRLEIHAKSKTWRTFVINGKPCGVTIEDFGRQWWCTVYAERRSWKVPDTELLEARVLGAYGFDQNYRDFHRLCRRDAKLRLLLGNFVGMRSSCPENLFEISVIALLLQNTTMRRSRDMLDAILRLAGVKVEFAGVELYAFCTPLSLAGLGRERLRGEARVGYRDKVLVAIAEYFMTHPVECVGSCREELLESLCQIKGIGPYTAGVVAGSFFRDQREYGLDVWNSKIVKTALGLDASLSFEEIRRHLSSHYAPCEGLVVEMLVEGNCFKNPVTEVYETEEQAKVASRIWPRPILKRNLW